MMPGASPHDILGFIKMKMPDGTIISYFDWVKMAPDDMLHENVEKFLAGINVMLDGAFQRGQTEPIEKYHFLFVSWTRPDIITIEGTKMLISTGGVTEDYYVWQRKSGAERLRNDLKVMIKLFFDKTRTVSRDELEMFHGLLVAVCCDITKPVALK
jgi:hypothetical protein